MSYDKEKLHIKIDGDETQFRDDLFAHFANVTELAKRDMAAQAKATIQNHKTQSVSFSERLQSLPKSTKAILMAIVFWTAFVIFRTSGDYDLLGVSLDDWDEDDFFFNWLLPPAVLFALALGVRWVLADKKQRTVSKASPLADFEVEITNWPQPQAKAALLVIRATLAGDSKRAEALVGELTVGQMRKVVEVLKRMEQHSN